MIKEFRNAIKANLHDRVTYPFSGALIISAIVWNWEFFFLLLFSKKEVFVRLNAIKTLDLEVSYWAPVFTSLFIVSIFPWISRGTGWVYLQAWKGMRNDKKKCQADILITPEEKVKLMLKIKEYENKFSNLFEEKI